MATIREEIPVTADPDTVWDAVRDWGALHVRLVPGFVTDCVLEENGDRIITFFNGSVARESLITADDNAHRLVYIVKEGSAPFTHYQATLELAAGDAGTRLVWTIDLAPDSLAEPVAQMMQRGAQAMADAFGRP